MTTKRDPPKRKRAFPVIRKLDHRILQEGVFCLEQRDPELAGVVSAYGPPPLWERPPGFATLVHIILEQQVSLKSARAAYRRLEASLGRVAPEGFLKLTEAELKAIGFSRQKIGYGRELATAVTEGGLNLEALAAAGDAEARGKLMSIRGIGRWTADIYLVMALGRPDVWPCGDVALATAVQRLKGLPERPDPPTLTAIAEAWKPWRSVAARLCWHSYLCEKRGWKGVSGRKTGPKT
jgi:DNA-3-methyladenine glycosylase II